MDGEDYRTGSADSENGSDNSYVKVSSEDMDPPETEPAHDSPQLISGTGIAPEEDYTFGDGETGQDTVQVRWSFSVSKTVCFGEQCLTLQIFS